MYFSIPRKYHSVDIVSDILAILCIFKDSNYRHYTSGIAYYNPEKSKEFPDVPPETPEIPGFPPEGSGIPGFSPELSMS